MREILFRAKRLNGEWVEGAYCSNVCDSSFAPMIERPCIVDLEFGFWYEVDPDTVSQYTGLCDKYGERIFDGDIVIRKHPPMLIVWDEEEAAFAVRYSYGGIECENSLCGHEMLEVIGNIYDNPEMLEGEG